MSSYKVSLLKDTTHDAVYHLLYYDRKDDEDLHYTDVDDLLDSGEVTVDDLCAWFREGVENWLKGAG